MRAHRIVGCSIARQSSAEHILSCSLSATVTLSLATERWLRSIFRGNAFGFTASSPFLSVNFSLLLASLPFAMLLSVSTEWRLHIGLSLPECSRLIAPILLFLSLLLAPGAFRRLDHLWLI
jgi:hypothetical protein